MRELMIHQESRMGDRNRASFFIIAVFLFILITGCATIPENALQSEADLPDAASLDVYDIEESSETDAILDTVIETVKKPMIAITFDDGPSDYTRRVLDILEKYGVRATFFVMGENVEDRQEIIIHAVKNGNEIAGHTWSHVALTRLSNQEIEESIQATSAIIEKVTGIPCCSFYRPPYGLVNRRVANVSAGLGYSMVGWTVDPQEWKHFNVNLIYKDVMRYTKENSIILLHDIFAATAGAMERLIPAFIARGYHFVTVSELLNHVYGELEPGRMYGSPGIIR